MCCSLQFETEAEGGRLRRDVTAEGSVAPVGATRSERSSIQSIFSGREELFAFQRAVRGFSYNSFLLLGLNLSPFAFKRIPETGLVMRSISGRIPIIYSIPESLPQAVHILCAGVQTFGNANSNIFANTGLSPKVPNASSR